MKNFTSKIIIGIVMFSVFICFPQTSAFAYEITSVPMKDEEDIEQMLFDLVDQSAERAHLSYLASQGINSEELAVLGQEGGRQELLNNSLSKHKNGFVDNAIVNYLNPNSWDGAPDLSAQSNVYTVTCYDKTYTSGTKQYPYRIIYVVDNKGGNGLTNNTEFDAVPHNLLNSGIRAVLSYTFKNTISTAIGTILGDPRVSWTLGALFDFLDGIQDPSRIQTTNESLYRIFISSQTMMRYVYLYDSNEWKLVETSGYTRFIQTDFFAGKVDGVLRHEDTTHEWTINTCGDETKSIKKYFQNKTSNPRYRTINSINKFEIEGFKTKKTYKPCFVELPGLF